MPIDPLMIAAKASNADRSAEAAKAAYAHRPTIDAKTA